MEKEQEGLKVSWVYADKVIEFPIALEEEGKPVKADKEE